MPATDRFTTLAEIVAGVPLTAAARLMVATALARWVRQWHPDRMATFDNIDRFLRACGVGKEQERG